MKIAAFELLPTDYIYGNVLGIEIEGKPINSIFEDSGFEHHLMINNLGTLGVAIAIIPLQILIYYCIAPCNNFKCCKKSAKKLGKQLFWGVI